jgi:hypothetical protein
MNPRYQGPAIFPPANEARKRIEAHLDQLPSPAEKAPSPSTPERKAWTAKLRRLRRRP